MAHRTHPDTGNFGSDKQTYIVEEHFSSLIGQLLEGDIVLKANLFQWVNNYKMKNDPSELKKVCERLLTDFPDTAWAKWAAPYRLL